MANAVPQMRSIAHGPVVLGVLRRLVVFHAAPARVAMWLAHCGLLALAGPGDPSLQ